MTIRPTAVAGTWYPGIAGALTRDVDAYLNRAPDGPAGTVHAIIAPHAGLMFSGPVGAYAYKATAREDFDVAVLVGPSHFVAFEGVALWPDGAFDSPLGAARIDEAGARAIAESPVVHDMPSAHRREHSLEMQLPFLRRVHPELPSCRCSSASSGAKRSRRWPTPSSARSPAAGALIASTDLSHYFDAKTATALDGRVQDHVAAFDADGLLERFEQYPEHDRGRYVACGGGAAIAVMKAARGLGATDGRVLKYAHSGEVSGDYDGVVGYLAAAFGKFSDAQ
jgi:AmmeMemoRadiSam system protein B